MPQPNGAADPGVKTETTVPAESASTAVTPEAETQTANVSSSSLMDTLEIPAEVQEQLAKQKQPVAEETAAEPEQTEVPEAETPTAEAAPVEQPETQPESETTDEQPEASGDWPESAKKRVAKLAEQKRKAKEKAEALEDEIAELKSKLDGIQPVTVAPHAGDLLANVQNEQQLAQVVQEARVTRDWCLEHLGTGFTMNEGQENETLISPKEIGQKLALVEDILTIQAPRKQAQMGQRVEYDKLARQHYPAILDKGSEDYQVGAALMQQLPGLVNHPGVHLILGDYIAGVKQRIAKANGNGKTKDLPPELQRPIPPIAPPVPAARSNGSAVTPQKKKDEALNQLIESGGDREAVIKALGEMRKAQKTATNPRQLVSV